MQHTERSPDARDAPRSGGSALRDPGARRDDLAPRHRDLAPTGADASPSRWAAVEDPPPGDRVRAARVAADLSREQLAERIGSSARTIRRLEDGKRRATQDEQRDLAAACRVPEWFLAHGWSGWEREAGR